MVCSCSQFNLIRFGKVNTLSSISWKLFSITNERYFGLEWKWTSKKYWQKVQKRSIFNPESSSIWFFVRLSLAIFICFIFGFQIRVRFRYWKFTYFQFFPFDVEVLKIAIDNVKCAEIKCRNSLKYRSDDRLHSKWYLALYVVDRRDEITLFCSDINVPFTEAGEMRIEFIHFFRLSAKVDFHVNDSHGLNLIWLNINYFRIFFPFLPILRLK